MLRNRGMTARWRLEVHVAEGNGLLLPECRGLKELIKEAKDEVSQQGAVAFSPRTTSLTVLRPRGQKPADERFFEKLEEEVRRPRVPPRVVIGVHMLWCHLMRQLRISWAFAMRLVKESLRPWSHLSALSVCCAALGRTVPVTERARMLACVLVPVIWNLANLSPGWGAACMQVSKINKFTQSQVLALKKRLKGLRDQVRDSKDASKSEQLTQVRNSSCSQLTDGNNN